MTGQHLTDDARALSRLLELQTPLAVSVNDDWANLASDVAEIIAELHPLVAGVQEGYRRHYGDDLPPRYGVRQRLDDDSTAGVAVIWDRQRLHEIGHRRRDHHPHLVGHGFQPLGSAPGLRMRGVFWTDLAVDAPIRGIPDRFRLASTHRFPVRDREHWPAFDRPYVAWLRKSPLPTITLMDSNQHGGPAAIMEHLGKAYRWRAEASSIDGGIVHSAFHAGGVIARQRVTSDHDAAVIPLGRVA